MRLPPLLTQAVLVTAIGGGVGLAANALSASGIALSQPVLPASASATVCADPAAAPERKEHPFMPIEQALEACSSCSAGFVDARGAVAYAHGHIPGAIHLPPEGKDAAAALASLRGFGTVVVYDDDARCELAQGVADRLVAAGVPNVRLLEGSWTAWEAARGPAQAGACEACSARKAEHP